MKERKSKSSTGYFIGGAALGAVIALLFAPKRGTETRKDIEEIWSRNSEKGRSVVNRILNRIPGRVKAAGAFGAIKEGGREALRAGKQKMEERSS